MSEVKVFCRWMVQKDMDSVLLIEKASFDDPWNNEEFIHCLRQRACIGMVAEHDNNVVGFVVYEITSHRLCIHNMAVSPDHRLRSVGRQMIEKLKSKLIGTRRQIALAVRESNLAAQKFFRACGLRAQRIEERFFTNDETAYHFAYWTRWGKGITARGFNDPATVC